MEQNGQDEITLKEIILTVIGYFQEIIKNWKLLIIIGLIIGTFLAIKAWLEPVAYHEKLTFMMDDSSGDSAIPGLEILGDLFGGGGGSGDNLDKILQLFESKKIINNTLFDTVEVKGKKDFLANHFLKLYSTEYLVKQYRSFGFYYATKWPKKLLENEDFQFTHRNIPKFTDEENLFLRLVFERINGTESGSLARHLDSDLDQSSGIMTLKMSSEHQDLTLGVLNNIYEQLSNFFIEKATERQTKTFNIMKAKKDSVITELKTKEFQLANFKDTNRKLVTVKGYLKQLRLERDVAILNVMYAEVVKQLEATDFALKNKTPVVQIIDLPRTPIIPTFASWKRALLLGMFIGLFVGAVFIVIRKIFLEILEENPSESIV